MNSIPTFNNNTPSKIKLPRIYNKAQTGFLTKKLTLIPPIIISGSNVEIEKFQKFCNIHVTGK